jgi:hypothetical protein
MDKLLEVVFASFSYQFSHKIHSSCSGTVQIFNNIYVHKNNITNNRRTAYCHVSQDLQAYGPAYSSSTSQHQHLKEARDMVIYLRKVHREMISWY